MRTDSPALEVSHLAKPGARGEGAPGKPLTEAGEIAAPGGGKTKLSSALGSGPPRWR